MGNSNKKSNYIVQGGILAAASILVRIIGMVYRIPVTRILGPIGNSYYSAAYEVYSMMLLISSFSLPLAVSKLVSARLAAGQAKSAYKIFRCTLVFALVSGGIASLLVYFGAGFFSDVLVNTPESKLALQVLAPDDPCGCPDGVLKRIFSGSGKYGSYCSLPDRGAGGQCSCQHWSCMDVVPLWTEDRSSSGN